MSSVPLEPHPSQPSWKPWTLRTSPVAPSPTCSTVPCVLEVRYTERAFSLVYSFVHLLTQYTFGSVPLQLALCETDTWSKSRGSSKYLTRALQYRMGVLAGKDQPARPAEDRAL